VQVIECHCVDCFVSWCLNYFVSILSNQLPFGSLISPSCPVFSLSQVDHGSLSACPHNNKILCRFRATKNDDVWKNVHWSMKHDERGQLDNF